MVTGAVPVVAVAVTVAPVSAGEVANAPPATVTASLKVTRKSRVSALVSAASAFVPSWRSTEDTVGAVLSRM